MEECPAQILKLIYTIQMKHELNVVLLRRNPLNLYQHMPTKKYIMITRQPISL